MTKKAVIFFDHACLHGELEIYIKEVMIPCMNGKGISAHLLKAVESLSPREYQLVLEGDDMPEGGGILENLLCSNGEGRRIYEQFSAKAANVYSRILGDMEPDIPWFCMEGRLYHLETFNSVVGEKDFESLFLEGCFPYWRQRGFHVKLFRVLSQPDSYMLMTEMKSIGSIDSWPEMATGEAKGKTLMQKVVSSMDYPRGSIVRDI